MWSVSSECVSLSAVASYFCLISGCTGKVYSTPYISTAATSADPTPYSLWSFTRDVNTETTCSQYCQVLSEIVFKLMFHRWRNTTLLMSCLSRKRVMSIFELKYSRDYNTYMYYNRNVVISIAWCSYKHFVHVHRWRRSITW